MKERPTSQNLKKINCIENKGKNKIFIAKNILNQNPYGKMIHYISTDKKKRQSESHEKAFYPTKLVKKKN